MRKAYVYVADLGTERLQSAFLQVLGFTDIKADYRYPLPNGLILYRLLTTYTAIESIPDKLWQNDDKSFEVCKPSMQTSLSTRTRQVFPVSPKQL